jgi:L-ascorbate metabolism protein UlaG (beta-lactamase superfamily)
MEYISNPQLKNHYPENFKGTPFGPDGRFRNLAVHYIPGFKDALRWKFFSEKPLAAQKKNESWKPEVITGSQFLQEKKDCLVWLAHASFYLQLGGKKILIDPVFGNIPVIKRGMPPPCPAGEYKHIDYLLISHNHRDHTEEKTLRILSANNPQTKVLTGLKQGSLLKKWLPKNELQEAGWFQQYDTQDAPFEIFYVPTRHWSKRWLNDDNKSLWGGFMIRYKGKTIYFMGDSGYGDHFKLIAEVFPSPDICLMGIGAFMPEWFMGPSHLSPTNSVRAFNEMKGKLFIPMHYGTFDLSDEPFGEPLRVLKELVEKKEIMGEVKVLKAGEVLEV